MNRVCRFLLITVFAFLYLFALPHDSTACVKDKWLRSKACSFELKNVSEIEDNKTRCGFTDEEAKWLTENIRRGNLVQEETDSEYESSRSQLEADKVQKTIFNFWKWKTIDSKNNCGKKTIIQRWTRWTIYYEDNCHWDEKRNDCVCPNC